MKFSKNIFFLLIFWMCIAGGGISCSLLGGKSSSVKEDDFSVDEELESFDEDSEESLDLGEEDWDETVEPLDEDGGEFLSEESLDESDEFEEEFEEGGPDELDEFAEEEFEEEEFEEEGSDELDEFAEEEFEEEGSDELEELAGEIKEEGLDGPEEVVEEEALDESEEFAEEDLEALADTDESETTVSVTNIQFLADQRGGVVAITTNSEAKYETRFNTQTNQYVIDILNAFLPKDLHRPFIMKDFKMASFGAINAYQQDDSNKVSVVVQMKTGSGSPSVEQEGAMLYVVPAAGGYVTEESFAEETAQENVDTQKENFEQLEDYDEQPEDVTYESSEQIESQSGRKTLGARSLEEFLMNNNKFYGRKISLTLQDVNIVDAINFIAEESGANLVLSQSIQGKVTMKLREVPWDQALVVLLRTHKLGYVRQGNIIRISTLAELQEESNAAKLILEAQKSLLPVYVRKIPVSYAKVEAMQAQLTPFLTPQRGRISIDARTSSVIVTDVEEVLDRMLELIKSLDVPPEQVMIEGKVVEATEEFSRRLGITWGLSGSTIDLGGGGSSGPLSITPSLGVRPVTPESIIGSVAFMSLNIGTLDFLGDLDAALELAETESIARVISAPRIVTINKEASSISQQGEVLSLSSVSNQGVITRQVNRTSVTLSLNVTPQITAAGGVIMEVNVQRQFPGAVEDTETLARAVNSRSAQTKVLVHNGQTAVIGGIYNTREGKGETGPPIVKHIPIVGWLFKHRVREVRKNELLIFLTPRIMKETK